MDDVDVDEDDDDDDDIDVRSKCNDVLKSSFSANIRRCLVSLRSLILA